MGNRRTNRGSKNTKNSKKAVAVESENKQLEEMQLEEKQLEDSELEDKLQEKQTQGDENEEDDNDVLNVEGELNGEGGLNGEGELNGEDEEEPSKEDDEHMKETLDSEVQTQKETVDHEPKRKRLRGPTKMKHIAKDPNERQHVHFTHMGEPCGPGSVLLSSYLGPLVREHVPYVVQNWKAVSEDIKTVLWKSIVARFDVDDQGYKKTVVFKQMGGLWRASKSRVVTQVRQARTLKERMNLQPKNVVTSEWRKFIKEKTSNAFKVVSDSYKERRQKQIPHTCGRKGMVKLREDLVKNSPEPSKVTRLRVWVKSRTRKDGTLVNVDAAEKIRLALEMVSEGQQDSATTNPKEDMLTQILGPDNPGRLRTMGRGMSLTKLACFEVKNNCIATMEENQIHLQKQVDNLKQVIAKMNNQREEPDVGENSIHKSVNTRSLPKCFLVDWSATDQTLAENVAEGRVVSYDADEIVNGIPLGPNSVKVLVESAIKPEAFLWRPAHEMFTVEDALGEMVAWQADYCIVPTAGFIPEDIAPKSPSTSSKNICKLMDYIKNDEVVAEGRWQTQEPKALVNGLPLGPNAIKVYLDKVVNPTAYIWRPTVEMRTVEDSLNHFVAWPANRVVIDTATPNSPDLQPSTSKAASRSSQNEKSPVTPAAPLKKPAASLKASSPRRTSQRLAYKENQKCKLMDLSGNKRVVAEGRWSSNNPDQVVHFVPLGHGACRVWVDVVKVKDAAVWRTSSEIEYMQDALGSSITWPADKVVME